MGVFCQSFSLGIFILHFFPILFQSFSLGLFYTSLKSSSFLLISIAGKDFTSHGVILFSFYFWFRDLLRELTKKYEILLICLFLLFFLFLASEALLFMSFFWASFHSLCSPTLGVCLGEGFYLPDPCELTFANTLLLSNAAVSLGGAFVSLEISSQFYIFFSLFSFIQ